MTTAVFRPSTRRDFVRVAVGGSLAMAVTGCSALNGGTQEPRDDGDAALEKSSLTVGLLQSQSSAAAKIAEKYRYFRDHGLVVSTKVYPAGPQAIAALLHGELDVAVTNYVSFFQAVAQKTLPAKVIANGNAAAANSIVVMTTPDSGIAWPKDLVGRKVAIQQAGSVAELLLRAQLKDHDVNPAEVKYLPVKFQDAAAALAADEIDAAVMIEPFITQGARQHGLHQIIDLATASTVDIPLAGYIALNKFIDEHPRTIAAVQHALAQGQQAATDRATLLTVIPELTGVDAVTVDLLTQDEYPVEVSPAQLQRVITLMQTYSGQATGLQAGSFIVPTSGH